MANSLTAYTPELWARESLEILREAVVMPQLVRVDFSNDLAQAGDVVNTRRPAKMTSGDVDPVTGVTVQDVAADNVPVTLNQHKNTTFRIRDREATRSFVNLVTEFLDPAMLSLANTVDKSLLGLYTDLGTPLTATSVSHWKLLYGKARVALNKKMAPMATRYAVLSDDDEGLVSDLDILSKVNESGSSTQLREGSVGRYRGFDTFRSSNVDEIGSSGVRHNMFFHRNAFALVTRSLATAMGQTPGAIQRVAVDPDAGLSIRVTLSYNATLLATQVTCDILYGVKTLYTDLGVMIRCSLT